MPLSATLVIITAAVVEVGFEGLRVGSMTVDEVVLVVLVVRSGSRTVLGVSRGSSCSRRNVRVRGNVIVSSKACRGGISRPDWGAGARTPVSALPGCAAAQNSSLTGTKGSQTI